MLKIVTGFMVSLLIVIANSVTAHDGITHHADVHNEWAHFAVHALMALPVVIGAWLLIWGAKHFIAKRTDPSKRD